MGVLQYRESLNSKDVQVWDNASFDNGESEASAAMNLSWSSLKSLESYSSKENQTPSMAAIETPLSTKPLIYKNPLRANTIITNTQRTPLSKPGISGDFPVKENIDSEIEELENEINRLSTRLESLRLEKARRNAMDLEKRGRIVAAKFKDEQSMGVILKTPKKGLITGQTKMMREARRGVSLGPVEIYSATKLKQFGKLDVNTPVQPSSSRRKSCYWKIHEIDELRVAKERGKSMSLSPKSRAKTASHVQAATTVGSRKGVKKEDGVLSSIQPKKLFTKVGDGEKPGPAAKKPVKSGRVVASRYNRITNGGVSTSKEFRKRSLPENEEDNKDSKMSDRKRVSLNGAFRGAGQTAVQKRVNKQLDVPGDVAIQKLMEHNGLDVTEEQVSRECPLIVELNCTNECPQDSNAAKEETLLVERKSFFNCDDDELSVFSFEEEDGEED